MNMHRHVFDKGGEESAGDRDGADQQREGEHLRRDHAGQTEYQNLDDAGRKLNHRVDRDHGGSL